jgi:hypothetical protein
MPDPKIVKLKELWDLYVADVITQEEMDERIDRLFNSQKSLEFEEVKNENT